MRLRDGWLRIQLLLFVPGWRHYGRRLLLCAMPTCGEGRLTLGVESVDQVMSTRSCRFRGHASRHRRV